MSYLHKNLKFLRKTSALTQEKFGWLFTLSEGKVKSYERGTEPTIEKFLEIAEHFSVDPFMLYRLDIEDHRAPSSKQQESGLSPSVNDTLENYISKSSTEEYQKPIDEMTEGDLKLLCKRLLGEKAKTSGILLDLIKMMKSDF
ncbi:MAG: helix-turn-helix transcriptional regulator [Ekhidna sp.]